MIYIYIYVNIFQPGHIHLMARSAGNSASVSLQQNALPPQHPEKFVATSDHVGAELEKFIAWIYLPRIAGISEKYKIPFNSFMV